MVNNKKMINRVILLLIVGLFFASCGERPLYTRVYSFDNNLWNEKDTAVFEVDIADTTKPYQSTLFLRTTTDYLYSNLWVYVDIIAPDSVRSRVAYPISITRADGSWVGEKSGTIVNHQLTFNATQFPLKGKYIYKISQAVSQKEIENILDIGLTLAEIKK
jgi:gliding motility-associated lipoprotein GldH